MVNIDDYEETGNGGYKLDITGFIDDLIRERLDNAIRKEGIKVYDVDYEALVIGIIYEYLSFRTLNIDGSVQDFLKTRHMENCITIVNENMN